MHSNLPRAAATSAALFLLACGAELEGVYSGEGTGFLDRIEFKDDDRVELTFMGMTKEGTFEVEDEKVRINNGGEISILRIEGDCLVGGGILGKYCKVDGDEEPNAVRSAGLAGSTFAAGMPGEQMVLEFVSGDSVRMSLDGETQELSYEVNGNQITVEGVEGRELVMTLRGDELHGGPELPLIFRKEGW
jgi:hypothetical protein